jgi:hypothetical protein
MDGQAWVSLVDASTDAAQYADFQKYYKDLYNNYATSIGEYNSVQMDSGNVDLGPYEFEGLAAGGDRGDDWSYLFKSGFYEQANSADYVKDTIRELTLSYDSAANADGSRCRAASCPYDKYWVFLSNPITVGEVLNQASQ